MSSKIKLMPQSYEYDEMYLTINGVEQGLISKGASSAESLGSHYKRGHGHEDAISISGFSYGGSNPINTASGVSNGQSHSNAFGITKMVDKSSPLLHNAMKNGEPLSSVELKCYRTSYSGQPEHYYTIHLKHARVVVIDTFMALESSELLEHVYFSYHHISIVHERCGTIHKSNWQHSTSLHNQRYHVCNKANDFNGYNALMASLNKRSIWIDKHPEYFAKKAQRVGMLWTIVALPLGGVGLYRGSYGAYMWAYRNPVLVGDFITGFANPAFLNPFNPAHRAGFIARKTLEAMTR